MDVYAREKVGIDNSQVLEQYNSPKPGCELNESVESWNERARYMKRRVWMRQHRLCERHKPQLSTIEERNFEVCKTCGRGNARDENIKMSSESRAYNQDIH